MRRFKIADLRLIFENDVRFLGSFKTSPGSLLQGAVSRVKADWRFPDRKSPAFALQMPPQLPSQRELSAVS